jgi:hypothetical protein
MKMFVCFLCAAILFSSNANAQKDKDSIHAAIIDFFEGISAFDNNQLKARTTADFQLLEDGQVWNLDTLIAKIAPMKTRNIKRVNQFNFITTEQAGNTAWVSYNNQADFSMQDKKQTAKWLESAVLVKEKGRWKIRMMHSTHAK